MLLPRRYLFSLCITVCAILAPSAALAQSDDQRIEFFERKIRPVLVRHCYKCHSADSEKVGGEFLLDSRERIRGGGESGAAVVPGEPQNSLLLEAIRYDGLEMPPNERLPAEVIGDFETWIRAGAADPRENAAGRGAPAEIDMEAGRAFWAFQPLVQAAPPDVQHAAIVRDPLDGFVLHRLEAAGLEPNPVADKRVLVRRLFFDLIGLPPTQQEVQEFVEDDRPDAHERLADRLLSSPHAGEHRARPWLDLARYAEDQAHIVGSNKALFYPNAYRYRDWLIDAMNQDLRFDEFVRLQLAADLVESPDPRHEPALGFMGLGPKYYRRGSAEVMADEWEDRVDVVSRGLLGLTVACARCHDHKFDPIATEDYYGLAGVFASTEMVNKPLPGKPVKNGQAKNPSESLHIIRDGKVRDLNVFIRGDVETKGDVVPRRFLSVLSESDDRFTQGSGRLELANAILGDAQQLTARVFANRVWGQLTGRPIVGTPSNFGALGQRPTHPLLLDELAADFIRRDWSVKQLIRRVVCSHTYKQSSAAEPKKVAADPENRLFSRMNRRRLSIEAWRDAQLAVTGRLNTSLGGQSIDPQDPMATRRTIYSAVSRFELNPMLALYDFPDPNNHAGSRTLTITPLQKLFVLNSPWSNARASQLASGGDDSDAHRVRSLYQRLLSRDPSPEELRLGVEFVGSAGDADAWQRYAQVLLASNEMMYVD